MATISDRLKEAMKRIDITQAELVKRTGINKGSLSCYVDGKYNPKQNNIFKLAKALNVDEAWLMGHDVPMERKHPEERTKKGVKIPVLGTVIAGLPMEATENVLDYEEIDEHMASTGKYFGLKIKGNSMKPRMQAGDVVIVRQQPDAESGDVVIAKVNGNEATCKKLIKHEDGITLQPLNSEYTPLYYSNEDIAKKPVTIIGKVVELRATKF